MFRNLAMLGIWNYSEGNTGKDRIRLVILDREQWYNVTNSGTIVGRRGRTMVVWFLKSRKQGFKDGMVNKC